MGNQIAKEQNEQLLIVREINAPRKLVFEAFTEEKHMKHWWGPKGMQLEVHKFDCRPGGVFHYSMKNNDFTMWGLFKYIEIVSPEKVVFTNGFSDPAGNIAPAPFFDGKWPLEIMNVWTFEEKNGKTILTLKGGPHNATKEELALFISNIPSMDQGFGGTFDQLDAYLSGLNK